MPIRFSVLMPTYNQCAFIRRAIYSLMQQTHKEWELIIINDGCTDETEDFIADYLADERVTYIKNEENTGLGHALNQGLDAAKYEYIAYLPSDDFYFENHLESIKGFYLQSDKTFFVYSGIQYDMCDTLHTTLDYECLRVRYGHCIQLVQASHKKSQQRWLERKEYITEDLFQMYWYKLLDEGCFVPTNQISCFWTSYRAQRHCIVGERYGGGLNIIRSYYKINVPIKLRVSKHKFINEENLHNRFSGHTSKTENGLKILIVGELAYNPERIYALEQSGHQLYGLWVDFPDYSFCEVGPLPFGHIKDIPKDNWKESIKQINPDVIYGLLNAGAVTKAYQVIKAFPEIPFVWHMKEGPYLCLQRSLWDKLIYLYNHADGKIYLNETIKEWYNQFLPTSSSPTLILDGDLPKADYFTSDFSEKISDVDGDIHTLVAGRMVGITLEGFRVLAENRIHIHIYNENYWELNTKNENLFRYVSKKFFHTHQHINPENWVREFSKYDVGWLHCFRSKNEGHLMRASWDDLNIPARLSTYAAAGLPCIISRNKGHVVASKEILKYYDIGILFDDYLELAKRIKEEVRTRNLTRNMLDCRLQFSFDYHVPELINFFKKAITYKKWENKRK